MPSVCWLVCFVLILSLYLEKLIQFNENPLYDLMLFELILKTNYFQALRIT